MGKLLSGATLCAALLSISAVLGVANAQDSVLNEINPRVGFSSVSRAYSDLDARYARTGVRRDIAQIRQLSVGQSRGELEAVLGRPAITNGDGSLEFHISLRSTQRDRLICQYRVFFNGSGEVARGVWRRPQCASLVTASLD